MTDEQLKRWLDAYGGDPRRWPVDDADAGRYALAQAGQRWADALADARTLDDWLSSHRVAPPDAALERRILAAVSPTVRQAADTRTARWPWPRWAGAGLAGLALAGALAGMVLTSTVLLPSADPLEDPGWFPNDTAFGPLSTGDEP